jgi:O-glycosyl hydrolase
MLKAAKEKGVENLVMFCNSPPVYLTINGKAFTESENKSNLESGNYEAFAEYISKSLDYFEKENLHFDYVSPVNEPEWDWSRHTGQEGNSYTNQQIAGLVKKISQNFTTNHITAKIQVPESGLLVFTNPGYRFKPQNDNQANSFFKPGKADYIGDQEHLAKQICAHSYFTEWPLWINRKVRKRIARTTSRCSIEYWMTEYCILKENKEITGHGRDLGMHTALYVARIIHNDLVYGNASAWCWWLGISSADFKDGLVYVNRDGSGITDSKTMWAMGNFSRFIKPGAVRIAVKGKADKELLVSAFRNPGMNNIVVVIINMKTDKQAIILKNMPEGTLTAWETSEKQNLKKSEHYPADEKYTVEARSITSLVLNN